MLTKMSTFLSTCWHENTKSPLKFRFFPHILSWYPFASFSFLSAERVHEGQLPDQDWDMAQTWHGASWKCNWNSSNSRVVGHSECLPGVSDCALLQVHGLDAETWKKVDVVYIDIADRSQVEHKVTEWRVCGFSSPHVSLLHAASLHRTTSWRRIPASTSRWRRHEGPWDQTGRYTACAFGM